MPYGVIYYLMWADEMVPFYVGQTVQEPHLRWLGHTNDFRGHGRKVKNALAKGIRDGRRLLMVVVEEVHGDQSDLNRAEQRHEDHLRTEGFSLKNTAPCGGGLGRQSEEQRRATSEAVRAAFASDPTIKQRTGEAVKIRWKDDPECAGRWREGLRKARGASHTDVWRASVTESSRKILSKPCLVQHGDAVMMFQSQTEAAAQLGVSRQVLHNSFKFQTTGRHGYLVIDW